MNQLLLLVRDLCQLKRGPQDMPYSPMLLAVLLALSMVLDLAIAGITEMGAKVLLRTLISTGFVLGILFALLWLRNLRERFVQTALALIICSMLFALLILPIAFVTSPATAGATPALTPIQALLGWMALVIIVWKFAVDAHILRHALNIPFGAGLLIALLWSVADWLVARNFLGSNV